MNLSRAGKACLLLLAAAFFLLRFVHLTADYPRNIRWDDGIATDEGWYASSAIDAHTWGEGRLPGDMNISVLMPVWPAIARVAFAVGGFNVVSLRATAVLFYLFDVLLVTGLLTRYGAKDWIPLFAALAAVNPWAFVFSRSAFLEFPMLAFVLVATLAASLHHRHASESRLRPFFALLVSALSFAAAMLLKTTAIALFPIVIYATLQAVGFRCSVALRRVAVTTCGVALVYFSYWAVCIRPHLEDVHFYLSVVQNTLRLTPLGFLADASRPFRYGLGSDHLLFALTVLLIPASTLWPRLRALWHDPIFAMAALWLTSFLAFMVKHNNDPARYFAVVIPALLLLSIALLRNTEWATPSMKNVFVALLVVDAAVNIFQITHTMLHPTYSFANAAHQVDALVHSEAGASNVVIGDEAHEVALQSSIKPVNLLFHSQSIVAQMRSRQPDWWLQFSPIEDGRCYQEVLSLAYTAELRGEWEIFYPGQKLVLWRLHRIPGRNMPELLTPQQTAACSPPVYK